MPIHRWSLDLIPSWGASLCNLVNQFFQINGAFSPPFLGISPVGEVSVLESGALTIFSTISVWYLVQIMVHKIKCGLVFAAELSSHQIQLQTPQPFLHALTRIS